MNHSPTPWVIVDDEYDFDEAPWIEAANGKPIVEIWEDGEAGAFLPNLYDAEFIVKCVNCHDKLLAAAKLALGVLIEISNVASKAGIPKLKEFEALEKIIKEAEES